MTKVHEVLGEERVKKICIKHGLIPEDEKIIDEILVKWEGSIGKIDKKMNIAMERIYDNPRRPEIIRALLEISFEFLVEGPAKTKKIV